MHCFVGQGGGAAQGKVFGNRIALKYCDGDSSKLRLKVNC